MMTLRNLFLPLGLAAAGLAVSCQKAAPPRAGGPLQLAAPSQGAYLGAYVDFGDHEDEVTLEAIESFEELVGKHQAIIASSSYWGENCFPKENVEIISRHGSIPLIYWSPWDRPYQEGRIPGRFSLEHIIAGDCDAYIDAWAREAAAFGKPLLVAWGIEMNGDWFPWSGEFAGAGQVLPGAPGETQIHYAGPEMYKRAYRHVVDRARAQGARNIQWVFHANNSSSPMLPWNQMAQYYPGPAYADWLAMSAYGEQYPGTEWFPVDQVFLQPYKDLCALDPAKPILIAEWGVGEFPKAGSKSAWITGAFALFKTFPRLKGAVYWHERWQNGDESYSNIRVHSSPGALEAYRRGIQDPLWLDRPVFQPAPESGSPGK